MSISDETTPIKPPRSTRALTALAEDLRSQINAGGSDPLEGMRPGTSGGLRDEVMLALLEGEIERRAGDGVSWNHGPVTRPLRDDEFAVHLMSDPLDSAPLYLDRDRPSRYRRTIFATKEKAIEWAAGFLQIFHEFRCKSAAVVSACGIVCEISLANAKEMRGGA